LTWKQRLTDLIVSALDDHRMRYLYEAVRLGSVRAAADQLGINASVVSRQIVQLEKDLAISLIERLSRGVRATEAGELLVQNFRRWSAEREDTLAKLREIQGLKRGHLDIVLGEGFVSDLMSGPLKRFWQRHPSLTMSFELAGTSDVVRNVAEDRHHLGLVYNAGSDPRIRTAAASRQPICLVARPDHPLVLRAAPVTVADLAGLPLGLMQAGYGTRQIVAMAERADKVSLVPKLTTGSITVLRQFVKSGLGVTLLPAFSVTPDLAEGSLAARPIRHAILETAEAQLITRLGRELPDAASQLLRYLIRQMKAFSPPRHDRAAKEAGEQRGT
jgi:DNA-binding transcriptional LysR family regulator